MSSILRRERGEQRASSSDGDTGQQLLRAVKMAMEEAETSGTSRKRSSGRDAVRTVLLVDVGAALGYLLGRRGGSSEPMESMESRAEQVFESQSRSGEKSSGGGRSTLRTLFMLGAVVGIGYAIRKRMGSMDEITEQATERARQMADETAMRSGEAAGRTESVTGEAAERIEETGEMAAEQVESGSEQVADRVREGGEGAADQMESAGETVEEAEQQAEERAEEMSDDENEDEEEE